MAKFYYLTWSESGKPLTQAEIMQRMPAPMTADYAQLGASVFGSQVAVVGWPPPPDEEPVPWDKDLTKELPRHTGPWPKPNGAKSALDISGGWWKRTLDQITGLTYHHTLSHDPFATAAHCITKTDGDARGRPSTPYQIWVNETGEVYLSVPLTEGPWHDHTGHQNTRISVGLAGQLHIYHPPDAQLDAAAKVAAWAIKCPALPKITSIQQVKGHMDVGTYAGKTECPGWASAKSGNWKPELYDRIKALL